ncbi:MAG: DNA mismatch repair protein MutL [Bacteroidetes bacterium HGW-Bacteroidetes-1]|jgi:DNA mismatch repair protein MutL|nr:MAG: DNA mismatch repair protein MutL [Bacteroidetes bacterium HGW-Bacteroidetes-1]
MSDIIKLLPDSVANQIAAGEVIQRPASAVKELLENAIDAGATKIDLVLKDAGKTLIQVTDNGCGMSETDARMSFERHATSKISKAEDLFAIRTMGFRGEAMASIAAIAQVEMKTRRHEDEYGTFVKVEGSTVKKHEVCSCQAGTSIAIKNLFFNVPARRNFLKTPPAEMRHILEEFHRVCLINPEISFTLVHNEKELFHLYASGLKQRIVALFGNIYNERLLPVAQVTENMSVEGFIGKAEFARKTRGEQYFFVNKRFIKHHYLHHAVENAFHELLPRDSFPTYFLHITVDTAEIDINIHPTKTEVNFQDTKLVYAIIHAAVKKSLGQHNLSPQLDFTSSTDHGIDFGEISRANRPINAPHITTNPDYNPFSNPDPGIQKSFQHQAKVTQTDNWRIFYEDAERTPTQIEVTKTKKEWPDQPLNQSKFFQAHGTHILTSVKSGLMIIDQHLAHWRILFEKYLLQLENRSLGSQQELFPQTIQFNASDADLLIELMDELQLLGFNIEPMSTRTFVVNGSPEGFGEKDAGQMIERVLEHYKKNSLDLHLDKRHNLARSMSLNMAIRYGQLLSETEMSALIDQLFACQIAEVAPDGRKILNVLTMNDLTSFLNR